MKFIKKAAVITTAVVSLAFVEKLRTVSIWMAGDSTIAAKKQDRYPENGWGMPFASFFDSKKAVVQNEAQNGRSTRTFIEEGRWDKIAKEAREGDYVFIQFGHNDESKEKVDRYTTPEQYKANLARFVNDTRAAKAIPILVTPVSRRKFDKAGNQLETHKEYSPLVKQVADSLKVLFIDLDTKSRELYQKMGEENSKLLFLQLAPNEHPNYPNGVTDNTHFSELGARLIAQIMYKEIVALNIEDLIKRFNEGKK
ncbi:rhamnogalacturonan acetylesterase [Polluticaenibacter yanchengensis]|uniref:Rhamnogalacturonan acetylesterase n=1 Tax=Polluticaenibacter yanchengensis TaxID=3014562 RepID=A0ABT4UK36_9BACT|nr:rhamnogalacturonan acetylesterase [Chitinophagaceae bacterium LY-5]